MAESANLSVFGLGALARTARTLRELGVAASSVEAYAADICRYLHDHLVGVEGDPQTVLVRCYVSSTLGALPAQEQALANPTGALPADAQCLALLGTAGMAPEWCDRRASRGHRVIPLVDAAQVSRLPMIAELLQQLGIDVNALVGASEDAVLPTGADSYRLFHVQEASASPIIPSQTFVEDWSVASAVGFGGVLSTGEMFAVVLFTRVTISTEVAQLFGTAALSVGLALHQLLDVPLLEGGDAATRPGADDDASRQRLTSDLALELVDVHERLAATESERATAAVEASRRAADRFRALAAVALRLSGVTVLPDLIDVLIGEGLGVLQADGGSLALVNEDGVTVQVAVSRSFTDVGDKYATLPLDDALPTTLTARTGERVFVSDARTGLDRFPALAAVYNDIGVKALASVPLMVGRALIGSLTVTWDRPEVFAPETVELLDALAAQASQTLDRMQLAGAERAAHEALQRSLLGIPTPPQHLEVAVRYLPSSLDAHVGGDWYDVLTTPDGATLLSVGDVVGHDMQAAAVMGQLRNLLRGFALGTAGSPLETLAAVDAAVQLLGIPVTATAAMVRIPPPSDITDRGAVVTWSNAGHPPPLYRAPDGRVTVMTGVPDLLLGVTASAVRSLHQFRMEVGGTILLYTDGLIERRHEDLDVGLARLAGVLADVGSRDVEALSDGVLSRMVADAEDDIAIVAVRLRG